MSSCNDDEVINQSPAAPLQVSVNTQVTMASRAIIHDEYLPDGHSIGISLTAEDGSDYDGKQFFNLKYTASGTYDAQTWSSNEPASLSTTAGKVTAYYPYNPDVTDWTKIPVETASQTDYMYAKPVTGLNIVSPSAKLTMQHALTDVRINIKKGTYTGTGAVTKITAKAPAFATGASMSAGDGSLTSVTGGGAQFETELTDAAIATADVTQDFLVVPLASSTSGEVVIFVTIDDKKFTVNVPYTEAFLQGYSYIYNLTLDNEALTFKGVNVEEWGVKAQYDETLQFYDDQYIVEIEVPSDGYEFTPNMYSYSGTIDWGDGTKTEKQIGTTHEKHIYAKAGTYIVTFTGKVKTIQSSSISIPGGYIYPSSIITKLINIGKELGVINIYRAFYAQTKLSEIVSGALDGCTEVENFGSVFYNCTKLTEIPEGLFDNCTEVTSFYGTFYGCSSLMEIPEGLFDNCTEVTNFTDTFYRCSALTSIPEGLFDNNTKVTKFIGTFHECKNITVIPEGLFDNCTEVTNFGGTFAGTDITSIPEGLFKYNTKVTDFSSYTGSYVTGCFSECKLLLKIPERLFDYCTKVTNFGKRYEYSGIFSLCEKITSIPSGLFDNCTEVTDFGYAFYGCRAVQAVPTGLFKYNTEVTSFEGTFGRCRNITNIPEGLFDNCTKVTSFEKTFYEWSSLTTIPEGLFDNCTEVTSFQSTFSMFSDANAVLNNIPEGLFDNCPEVTTFGSTFRNCTSLQTIPEGLFDSCTKVTSFYETFSICKSLQEIPEGLFDNCTEVTTFETTFLRCTGLTSIPEGLFDKCVKVKNFRETFKETYITEIPTGLFDYCTEVTNFYETFYNCTRLTGESPYTVINIDGVDTKVHLYERSNYPEYFTAPTTYGYCFYYCAGLTDYSNIPSGWK